MSDEMTKEDVDGAGRELLHKFMAALNAHNAAGMDACLHFPHMRIGNGRVDVWDEPGANPMDMFERLKREDGSIIGVYETLCILMLKDGKWGMHARSSYGP